MKKTLLTFILTTLFIQVLIATGFSNVTVLPTNPSITDSVKVCFKYTAVSWPTKIHAHKVTEIDSNTYINICFGKGQRDLVSIFFDTVNIGVYPTAGSYHVTLYMDLTSLDDTLCTNSMWYDSAEVFFTVTEPTGISGNKITEAFSFYPNPTNDKLNCAVTGLSSHSTIQITTIEGRAVLTGIPVTRPNFEIDVSTLPSGIYFLQLSDERQRVVKKFVKY